ncbi:MAG: hypothetical protein JNM51_14870 [Bacteroidia bacterium]|nr:hypothetical protein [Bacteroidia bacterium]
MKTRLTYLNLTIVLVLLSISLAGQTNCSKYKIIGDWTYIDSFVLRQPVNIDSLVHASESVQQTLGSWTFKADGMYLSTIDTLKQRDKGYFNVVQEKCEIRLGTKKTTPEGLIFHILFLNDKYLVTKCAKPKGDYIYVHRRK